MLGNYTEIEKRLGDAGDEPKANSKPKSSEFPVTVQGLTFFRYGDQVKDRLVQFRVQDPIPVARARELSSGRDWQAKRG